MVIRPVVYLILLASLRDILIEFPKDVVLGKIAEMFLSSRVSSFDIPLSSPFCLLCRACRLCAAVLCEL